MKYFSPSYWFKLWVLSAPLFNDKTIGINAKSIDNIQKIKDWTSNNTSLEEINQPYNLSQQIKNQNIDPVYQTYLDSKTLGQELETSTHKHRHEKDENRHKRQNSNNVITSSLVLKYENGQLDNQSYLISLGNIIQDLINHGIIIHGPGTSSSDTNSYIINPAFVSENNQDKNFFRIPIDLDDTNASLVLVLRSSDFYLQGFILNNDSYYHFSDSTINDISNMNNIRLSISSEYPQGINAQITWESVINAFSVLTEFDNNNYNDNQKKKILQKNIIILALVISESLRFQDIANSIHRLEQDWELSYDWNTQFAPIVKNWNSFSKKVISSFFDLTNINNIENNVRLVSLKAVLLAVEYCLFKEKNNRRQKRHITTYPHYDCSKKFYYDDKNKNSKTFRLEYDNTHNNIVTLNLGKNNPLNFDKISVLNEEYPYVKASWGDNSYPGTKFSYFLKDKKISDLLVNEKITENNKEAFLKNHNFHKLQEKKETVFLGSIAVIQSIYPTFYWENNNYYLQLFIHQYGETWKSSGGELWMNIGNGIKFDKYIYQKYINVDSNIETQIQAPKSCETRFYYDNNKNSKTFKLVYDNTHNNIVTLNLGKNNPLNFDKISVLNEEYPYVKASWGDNSYPGTKFSDFLKDKKISDLLVNEKITENNKEAFLKNHNFHKLQEKKETVFLGSIAVIQSIYPTFYWENNNYYLQLFIHQYGETWKSSGGELWMNIGNGIKLQKENCHESRKKRNIKSNENKWTNEFTKDINHEQHLSITNNRNYVINNITTL